MQDLIIWVFSALAAGASIVLFVAFFFRQDWMSICRRRAIRAPVQAAVHWWAEAIRKENPIWTQQQIADFENALAACCEECLNKHDGSLWVLNHSVESLLVESAKRTVSGNINLPWAEMSIRRDEVVVQVDGSSKRIWRR